MKFIFRQPILLAVLASISVSLGCGLQSIVPKMPTFPPIPPTPSTDNVPTGSSPLSGDWQVNAEFGHFAFSVDPDGNNVTTATFALSNWTCGGTTLTTALQSLSQWPITNGSFGGNVNLNGNFHTMIVEGTYDETNDRFTGTWEENAHGAVCSGYWESIGR